MIFFSYLYLVQKCKSLISELSAHVTLLPEPEPWSSLKEKECLCVWFLKYRPRFKRQYSNVNRRIQNKKKKKHCQGIMEMQFICRLFWTCFVLLYAVYLSVLLSRSDPSWEAMNQPSNLPPHLPQPFPRKLILNLSWICQVLIINAITRKTQT